ncbi:MAG: hypothetical protein DVB31_04270 [Verrucomicrobia bacterium]|nr:MAG: hypothetical protein DVB31_04270 [Verrucomicrobiota bacterium]
MVRALASGVAVIVLGGSTLRGAVDEAIASRIRKVVRLPQINIQFKFGFTDAQDWLSEPEAPGPDVVERLKAAVKANPGDAEALDQIVRFEGLRDDPASAEAARDEAVAAWRKRADANPGDRAVLTGFARALRVNRECAEAERALRKATAGAGAPWEARYELATVLGELAMQPYFLGPTRGPGMLLGGPPITPAAAEESNRRNDEAMAIADQLVESAPGDPRGLARRARLRTNRALIEFAGRLAEVGKDGNERLLRMFPAMFPSVAVPDLEAALRLRPEDPRLIVGLVMHRLSGRLPELIGRMHSRATGGFDALTTSEQGQVLDALSRLERIAAGDDKAVAATALESAACIQLVVRGDSLAARTTAIRAIRLDPRLKDAFELALGTTIGGEKSDWTAAEEIVRERLKGKQDERTRLALVKILKEAGKPDEALKEVHAALKAEPRQASLEVAHLALHVRQGQFPGTSGEVPDLDRLKGLIEALPDGEAKGALLANFYVTASAMAALGGDAEGARRMLAGILAQIPDDEYAKGMAELVRQLP